MIWDALLAAAARVHGGHAALRDFCAFPDAPARQEVTPHRIPAASLMATDPGLVTDAADLAALRDAFIAASPLAQWRETYKGSGLGRDFLDRFACYALVGAGGAFAAPGMSAYVVYMPAGLHYPWHHHPAEELYFVLAGQAEFLAEGCAARTLGPGQHSFHASSQPHAMQTRDHPVMALVCWRGDLATSPVLTDREVRRRGSPRSAPAGPGQPVPGIGAAE